MKRIALVQYQKASVPPALAETLRQLTLRAAELGNVTFDFFGHSTQTNRWANRNEWKNPTGCAPAWSLIPAGREILLDLRFKEDKGSEESKRERELAMLWGLVVPLGFTPWSRYPLPAPGDNVFHYFGPWQTLYDHLIGEGRGEAAWPSLCAAAQCDVGAWEGPQAVERTVQAQLHRVGTNVGPVDGIIGQRTLEGLKRLGLQGQKLMDAVEKLLSFDNAPRDPQERQFGHVVIPGHNSSIVCSGQVYSTKTAQGAALTIEGPGRVIIDVMPRT